MFMWVCVFLFCCGSVSLLFFRFYFFVNNYVSLSTCDHRFLLHDNNEAGKLVILFIFYLCLLLLCYLASVNWIAQRPVFHQEGFNPLELQFYIFHPYCFLSKSHSVLYICLFFFCCCCCCLLHIFFSLLSSFWCEMIQNYLRSAPFYSMIFNTIHCSNRER